MRALVTGGAGFIGSNVADGLSENGAEVFIVDNLSTGKKENLSGKAEFFNVDITDKDALRKVFESVKPEIVFHLAAQIDVRKSAANPAFDASVNVIGAINVFELSVEYGAKRIVFSSTGGAIYGEPEKLPATEETEVAPLAPYGVSKYCGEQYLNYFKRLFGIERVILRYANVYGPRQDPLGEAGVVAIFTGKILRGENPVIFGDGEQTRDYVYVKDVVRANILAINGKEGTYNIGTGIETSVNELVKMFEKITGKEIIPQYAPPRKGEVRRISLSYEKAKKELGFEPEYPLKKGLRETLQWFRGAYSP
jgi:UDP-glucose 4-epimerase